MSPRLGILLLLLAGATPASAQQVHRVLLRHPDAETFIFAPDRVTVAAGEVVVFTVESGGPYVVGFSAEDLEPSDRARLQAALPEASGPLRGPVLAGPGASFRLVLPALPAGRYRFAAVTHAAYRMQGELRVR